VVPAVKSGFLNLYGSTGNDLYQFYEDGDNPVAVEIVTALLPMGDPIRDKQALKIGIEAILGDKPVTMDTFVDSENQQSPVIVLSNSILWINNSFAQVDWQNNSLQDVVWIGDGSQSSGYYLYRSDAKMYGKYLGITITSTATPFTISGFQFEHELRARF
jgi:hypothetical protein